jgi:uncharacterized membrane protein
MYFYGVKLIGKKIIQSPWWAVIWALAYFLYQWKGLSRFSLNGDEPFSVFIAQGALPHIWETLSQGNNPPLYESILHFWIEIFGTSERAVRSLSLLMAAGSIWIVFRMLSRFHRPWAHLTVMVLFFSNYFQFHATEARGYSLLILLSLMTTSILVDHVIWKKRLNYWRYAILAVVMLYTHFFGWWILLTHFLLFMASRKESHLQWKGVGIVSAIIILCYIPYGRVFMERMMTNAAHGTWVAPVTNMGSLHDFIFWCANKVPTLFACLILLLMGAVEFALQRSGKERLYYWPIRFGLIFFSFFAFSIYLPMPYFWEFSADWSWFFVYSTVLVAALFYLFFISSRFSLHEKWWVGMWSIPLLMIFLISTKVPLYLDRYVSFCVPFFYITISGVMISIWKRKGWMVVIFMLSFFWLTGHQVPPENRQVKKLVSELREVQHDQCPMVICPYYFDLNVLYYWDNDLFKEWGSQNYNESQIKESLAVKGIYAVADSAELSQILSNQYPAEFVYLDASADFSVPGNGLKEWFSKLYHLTSEHEIPEKFVIRTYVQEMP